MRHQLFAIWLATGAAQAASDPLGEVPQVWAARIAPIAAQRLDDLEQGSAARIRATRQRLGEALHNDASDAATLAALYGRLGALYANHRMYAGAEAALRNARALDPDGLQWAYYLAHLALEQGEPAQALRLLDEAGELDPHYPTLALRRGEALRALNRLDQARAAYTQALDTPGLRTAAQYGLAQLDLLERDWASAADHLQAVLEAQPDASAAHYALGQALVRLGRRDEARAHLEQRGRARPGYPDHLIDQLRSLQQGARLHFENAIDAVERHDYAAAVQAFATGLEQDPGNARARSSYARALWLNDERDAAQAQLRRAAADAPDLTLARFLLGVIADGRGDSSAAGTHYRDVLVADPTHRGALGYLASLLLREGNAPEAALLFERAIAAGATDMPVFQHYWTALHQAGADAVLLRDKLIEFDRRFPEPPLFRYLLAHLLLSSSDDRVRDPLRARQTAEQLYAAQPNPAHAELLAFAHAAAGDFTSALKLQQHLVGLAQTIGMWMQLGTLQEVAEQYRAGRLPDRLPGAGFLGLMPAPTDADLVIRNYPAGQAY